MIRLADYRPRSSLRVPTHEVLRPRFPVVDAHNHLGSAFGGDWSARTAEELLATLDEAGVETLVDLDGGSGDRLSREVERWQRVARIGSSCSRGWTTTAGPGIRRSGRPRPRGCATPCVAGRAGSRSGSRSGFGRAIPAGRLVAVDDERLDPLWATAAELDLPVVIHIADPVAFFQPLDATNERYEELTEHPDWHFWPTRPPGEPDAPGFPTLRRAAHRPGPADRATPGDDLRRRARRLRRRGSRAGLAPARLASQPVRRHRGPAR